MKKMVIALSLILIPFLVEARRGRGPGPGRHAPGLGQVIQLNRMQKFLKLTDQQVEKIYSINKAYLEKYYNNRKSDDKLKELSAAHKKAIEAELTAEQLKQLKERPRRGKGRRGPGPGFGNPNGPCPCD